MRKKLADHAAAGGAGLKPDVAGAVDRLAGG
jgi:hypothetical protein